MSQTCTHTCPACGHHVDIFRAGGGEALASEMNVSFLGKVPLDPAIVLDGDAGHPLTCEARVAGSGRAFREVVQEVLDRTRMGRVQLNVLQQ